MDLLPLSIDQFSFLVLVRIGDTPILCTVKPQREAALAAIQDVRVILRAPIAIPRFRRYSPTEHSMMASKSPPSINKRGSKFGLYCHPPRKTGGPYSHFPAVNFPNEGRMSVDVKSNG
jgi:hypothetical protein